MSTGLFQFLVLVGLFCLGVLLKAIWERLGEILDEMTGEAKRMRDEASFYDRPNGGRDQP